MNTTAVKTARIDFELFCPACGRKHLKKIPVDDYLEGWRGWHGGVGCECGAGITLSRAERGEYMWMVTKKRLVFNFENKETKDAKEKRKGRT